MYLGTVYRCRLQRYPPSVSLRLVDDFGQHGFASYARISVRGPTLLATHAYSLCLCMAPSPIDNATRAIPVLPDRQSLSRNPEVTHRRTNLH